MTRRPINVHEDKLGRARIVRFTKRGHAAYVKVHNILRDIEREWSADLGPKDFAQLKELLSRVWDSPLTP
jgi:DNA-binding MarR family transcriptional regulator